MLKKIHQGKYNLHLIPLGLFLATFLIYLHNLSPYVYGGDAGDFLVAVAVKGVPHPSGYPLFTLFGILFNYLPLNVTLAYKVGMVSSVFASLTVVLMYLTTLLLTKNKIISTISSLVLAFSYVFWLYAEVAEVFAMGVFFFMLLSYLALRYYFKPSKTLLYVLAFSTGLSLTHHLLVIAIFPSILILILRPNWKTIFDYKVILKCISLFVLGLLPYIYIPIAASFDPPHSWDNAKNLSNFIRLITRADYNWKPNIINDFAVKVRIYTLYTYFYDLIQNLTFVAVLNAIISLPIIFLKKNQRFVYLIILINFIITGPLYIIYTYSPHIEFYTAGIIERFYVFSIIYIVILFSLGSHLLLNFFSSILNKFGVKKTRIRVYKILFYLAIGMIPVYLFCFNLPKTNLSKANIGENLGIDYLRSLPKNSYLLAVGDTSTFNAWYVQYGLKYRQDIWVVNTMSSLINRKFVRLVDPKIYDLKYYSVLDFNIKVRKKLLKEYPEKSTFSMIGAVDLNEKGVTWLPYGLNYIFIYGSDVKLNNKKYINDNDKIWKQMRFKKYNDLSISEKFSQILHEVQYEYSKAAFNTGFYLLKKLKEYDKAKEYFELSESILPSSELGQWGLANYYYIKNDCKKSELYLKEILDLDIYNKSGYLYLYKLYSGCLKDNNKLENIKKEYKFLFKMDINDKIIKYL